MHATIDPSSAELARAPATPTCRAAAMRAQPALPVPPSPPGMPPVPPAPGPEIPPPRPVPEKPQTGPGAPGGQQERQRRRQADMGSLGSALGLAAADEGSKCPRGAGRSGCQTRRRDHRARGLPPARSLDHRLRSVQTVRRRRLHLREPSGLPVWSEQDRAIRGQDIVVWANLGMRHLPRAEDMPVMPMIWHGFKLRPRNFFDRNPAIDLRTGFATQ